MSLYAYTEALIAAKGGLATTEVRKGEQGVLCLARKFQPE